MLGHSATVLAASVCSCCIAGSVPLDCGRSFLPEFNEGTLTISAVTFREPAWRNRTSWAKP